MKKKHIVIYLAIIVMALAVRIRYFSFITGDYVGFLKPWVERIRELNGFGALKANIGNYNVPYMVILTLISYLKCNPLIPIKIVSVLFDIICSVISCGIIYKITNNKKTSLIGSAIIMLLPTVVLNGAMWGQCDSIYCSFVLLSIYFLIDKKYIASFISLGIAFAFKLQAVFILPIYILMLFRDKQVKWYYFLIIPVVNFILCLPAIIAGRSTMDVLTIYLHQTNYYNELTSNFTNIYSIIQNTDFALEHLTSITIFGLIITMIVFICIWIVVLIKKVNFDPENIITFSLFSIVIATFLLPRMHDRYMYVADILSVIWFVCYKKKIYIPLAINSVSFISYIIYLLGGIPKFMVFEVIVAIVIIYFAVACIYIISINKKWVPFIVCGTVVLLNLLMTIYSVYWARVISSIIYTGVIIYFVNYIFKLMLNNKSTVCKS